MTTTQNRNNINMAKNNVADLDLDTILDFLADKVAERLKGLADVDADDAPAKGGRKSSKKAAEPEEDEDDEDDEDEADDKRVAELMKSRITTLRKMAVDLGFDEEEVKEADKAELAQNIAEAEAEEGDSDDEDEDEPEDDDEADEDEDEEGDDEEGEYERDDLEGMTLTALKKIAKEEYEYSASDLKGLDKDAVIDMILGEDEGDDEDDEEEEDDWYTQEDLDDMSLAELKTICKDNDIPVKRGAKAADLKKAILELE